MHLISPRVIIVALTNLSSPVDTLVFWLQESDLRYLVENVWSGQSVVSSWEDLYDLLLVRWDKHKEWSPWNCILLTKEETTAHGKLHNLEEVSLSTAYYELLDYTYYLPLAVLKYFLSKLQKLEIFFN